MIIIDQINRRLFRSQLCVKVSSKPRNKKNLEGFLCHGDRGRGIVCRRV
ncbi:MAG: hypothetical protein MI923_28155 [Phycisphaerales bacterium]|nr:hypothetical protein [Phycisphaerales bacterium]